MQPAGLPGRTTGRGAATTSYLSTRRGNSLSPQDLDHRHAGTRVKDAFGATDAAGLRPVPDSARPPARTRGTCAQKGRVTRPVSHALQTAPQTRNCRPKPHLTPARS